MDSFSNSLDSLVTIGEGWRRRIVYEVRRTPGLLARVGAARPRESPRRLAASQLGALRKGLPWAPGSIALHFAALRRFVRWSGNPLGADPSVWTVASGAPARRRWLKPGELGQLYRSARGVERLLISLEGFNGLRRVEVLRLRWLDVDLSARRLHVLGKGRNGGKWRTIPMFPTTERIMLATSDGQPPEARVLPVSRSGADLILQRAVVRAGFTQTGVRVSHHDLRRTFGRLANTAGMDLVQLKNLYGHSSLDQTVHYIGLDEDRMREGLDRLARLLHSELARGRPSIAEPNPVSSTR